MKKLLAKLHLWLAVPFGIVITLLCLTGAILVFESEIKQMTNPSLYKAGAGSGQPLSFPELVKTVKEQLPDTVNISSIQLSSSPDKNYRLGIEGQRRTALIVDPYTGEVKGISQPYAKGEFFTFVRRLHRWFLLQVQGPGISWGKMITGVSTIVFVFIILSGMIIWIPKTWKGAKKRLSVKRGAGRFRLWYDFHLSCGQLASLLLLVMALTGLTWSFEWYRNGFYRVFGVEVTRGTGHGGAGAVPHQGGGREDSATSGNAASSEPESAPAEPGERRGRGNRPEGAGDGESPRAEQGRPERQEGPHGDKFAVWEKAVQEIIRQNPSFKTVTVQQGSVSVATSRCGNTRAADSYSFDTRSGEITRVDYYRDQPKSSKIRGWIYAVHVGSWGGIYTKVLYFITCLIGAALPLTGYYIWIKKRWKRWRKVRTANA